MTTHEIEQQLRAYGRMRETKYAVPCAIGARPGMPRQAHNREKPTRADRLCWMIDVQRALARLRPAQLDVIEVHLLQKRTLERTAFILGRSVRTIARRRDEALDALSTMPEFRT